MKSANIVVIAVIISVIAAFITTSTILKQQVPSKAQLISDFYEIENAVHVSPHSIRKAMDKGEMNFVLVDLRSAEEYETEHVVGAINIPAYKDKDNSDYGAVDRIVTAFSELPKDKDIIVYCYSTPCMTGRKIGLMLAEHGIYVKHLGIGWNEWRYQWTSWNHEHEWNTTDVEDYIASGREPGIPKSGKSSGACPIDNSFGC